MSKPALMKNRRVLDQKRSSLCCGSCEYSTNFSTGSTILSNCRLLKRMFQPHDVCSLTPSQFHAFFDEPKEDGWDDH